MQKVVTIFVFLIFCGGTNSVKAHGGIDSLEQVLLQIDSTTHRPDWLSTQLQIAHLQVEHAQFEEALTRFKKVTNSRLPTEQHFKLKAQIGIGEVYYLKGNYEKALSFLQPVYTQSKNGAASLTSEATRLAAMNHVFLGNYAEAYQLQINALQTFEELGDSIKIARLNYDIANTHFYQEQYQVALEYFQTALKIYQSHQDSKGLFRCYAAMGSVYGYLGQFEKSLAFNEYALKSARKSNNKQDISWALLNVGANYYSKKSYDRALQHLLEGLKLTKTTKDDLLASNILVTISRVYTDTKQIDLAINYLNQSLHIAQKSHDKSNIKEIYKWFADTYYKHGDLEQYHYYIQEYITIKDSLYNEEVMNQINTMRQGFELQHAEREKEIAVLKKNEEIQDLKNNSFIGGAVFSFLLLVLISIMMYSRNRQQKTLNHLLARKNEEILKQNQRLATSNKDLEQFAYIISHDLKEPLRNISGFTTLLKRRCKKYQDDEAAEYMSYVFNSVNQMHRLLTDLLNYSKINAKVKEQEIVDSNEILQNALSQLQHRIQDEKATVQTTPLPAIQANPSQLLQVFQNLIVNALKFRRDIAPSIKISYIEQEKDFLFSIQDNGIGIENTYFDKIFIPFQRLHNRGEYEGSGIGLSTCKKIIEEHGGTIWLESEVGVGTTFYFTLPKPQHQTTNVTTTTTLESSPSF